MGQCLYISSWAGRVMWLCCGNVMLEQVLDAGTYPGLVN